MPKLKPHHQNLVNYNLKLNINSPNYEEISIYPNLFPLVSEKTGSISFNIWSKPNNGQYIG